VDAEYYQPAYFEMAAMLEAYPATASLDALSGGIVCGPFGSALSKAEYTHSGVPLVRVADLSDFIVTSNREFVFVSKETAKRLDRYLIEAGDIAVSQRGTIAMFALMSDDFPNWLISANLIAVRKSQQLNPFYLNVFLNSKYGTGQLHRLLSGQIQPKITTDDVKSIVVPIPPVAFQDEIEQLVRKTQRAMKRAPSLYRQAEQLLLDELGLSDLELPAGLHNDAPISQAWEAHRIDAEYYQPRYEYLDRAIQSASAKVKPLGTLIHPIINGFDWRDFVEDGTPYIRVGDVYEDWIDLDNAFRVAISPEKVGKPVGLQVGDILFTRKGTFGQAAVVDETASSALISSEIMRLRLLDPSAVHPQYLSLYLNSVLGYTQVERRVHGAGFYSISQEDLGQILICVPGWKTQKKIAGEIAKSHAARHQAKALLEQAMHKVEAIIEREVADG
jgi:restriction endonuclease S subunit